MHCENIISDINLKNDLETIAYEDIFGSLDKQILLFFTCTEGLDVFNSLMTAPSHTLPYLALYSTSDPSNTSLSQVTRVTT